jgi:formylmethanofuran dehydrogenase subunit E
MSLVQIRENDKLVRDTHSKAILNTDRNGLEEYYAKREIAKKQNFLQQQTQERLSKIEEDMFEIKKLLQEIAIMRGK